ncbi:Putative N-acetyl-LL-diaminopimelate aminotransferase [Planctomycetes bacterium Poly30]|uniref:Aminotransferase n=1 Tax=Saltatorellus ferox TaxID=2528018 RepID=A0A518EXY9_9BACT|nr:Putative N-acetyl-LL-diaminopimelate aminotransferase [Planctomycetes bacterium Poly30]
MDLSQRARSLTESATLALAALAKAMADSGRDVINMAVGEPDFQAPRLAREAAHTAIDSGKVNYTPAAGLLSLRRILAQRVGEFRGVTYAPSNVVVCHSAKHALSHVLLALVDPGDEVLLLAPVWGSYDEEVRFAGGIATHVAPVPGGSCAPDLDAIRAAIGKNTRGLMLTSPSNPSGYVCTPAEIAGICEIVIEHDLWLISDEIYARLVFDGAEHVSPVSHSPEMLKRTIVIDGASKVFAMTGYRIGAMIGPEKVAKAVGDIQSQLSGCPNYISQMAYQACLETEPEEVAAMIAEFDRRRLVIQEGLERLGLPGPTPRGAFYAFPDMSAHFGEGGAHRFCAELLEAEALATVPGDVFGTPNHVRFSYALSEDKVREAIERLGRFLASRK